MNTLSYFYCNMYHLFILKAPESATKGWEDNQNGTHEPPKGIKRFRERNNTTNGFVRCDSDPNLVHITLTYKVRWG